MKAAILYETNTPLQVEDVTLDEPQDQEVLVKLMATGICHTDLSYMKGEMPLVTPVVLGHEGAGIVEKVAPGVTTLKPGDHVVLMVAFACGKCRYCAEGRPTLCLEGLGSHVMGTLPGGGRRLHKGDEDLNHFFNQSSFAEYAVVHERTAVKIRDDAPFEVVCLLGCSSTTGIGAVLNTAGIKAGESIVIYGCGGVGLNAIMGAKLAGAGKIIGVSRSDRKLEMAKELGADYVIKATEEDPQMKVGELTDGGADYAIECIGNVDTMAQAFGSIRNGGKCVIAGMAPYGATISVPAYEVLLEKTLTGTTQGDIRAAVDVPRYVDLFMAGKLPIDKLITRSYSLDNINEALGALERREVIRSVIRF